MSLRIPNTLASLAAATLLLCGARTALGQTVYGYSSIAVTQDGVTSTSSTDLDDVAQAYYTVETDAFLFVGSSQATSGTSTTVGGSVTLTQPVAPNTDYTLQTNHWVVPLSGTTGEAPNFSCGSPGSYVGSMTLSSCGTTTSPAATYVGTSYATGDSTSLAPAVSSVDQTTYGSGELGTTGYVIVYGSDLTDPNDSTTVSVGDGISATLSYISQTQLNIYYSIPASAATGSQTASISTTFGSTTFSFTVNPAPDPAISGVSPNPVTPGDSVTITGTDFGPLQQSSTVTFNGQVATVNSWSATSIVALVPANAVSGSISVTVAGITSPGFAFQVAAPPGPIITGVSPSCSPAGIAVTITGTNFGTTQGTVTINGQSATVVWGATSILAALPSGVSAGNATVVVTNAAGSSGSGTLAVTPCITGLSLTQGPAQVGFVISGIAFGASQGSSSVTLNETTALTVVTGTWSSTQVTVQVPQAASSGAVAIAVGGYASNNSVTFTVTQPFGCTQ